MANQKISAVGADSQQAYSGHVTGWKTLNGYGAVAGNGATVAQAIADIVGEHNISSGNPGTVLYVPPGRWPIPNGNSYVITAPNFHIRGGGPGTNSCALEPAEDYAGTLFHWDSGYSFSGSVQDVEVDGRNTGTPPSRTMTVFKVSDTRFFTFTRVQIDRLFGGDSVGIQTEGREHVTFQNCRVDVTVPVRMAENPNDPLRSADHFAFHSTQLLARGAASGWQAPATLPWACCVVDKNVRMTGFTVVGSAPWVGGTAALYQDNTPDGDYQAGRVSTGVNVSGLRHEQGQGADDYMVYLNNTANTAMLALGMDNSVVSDGASSALYARYVRQINMTASSYSSQLMAEKVMDVENCDVVNWNGVWTRQAGVVSAPDMTLQAGAVTLPGDNLPRNGVWVKT